jgi:hypothetical protein
MRSTSGLPGWRYSKLLPMSRTWGHSSPNVSLPFSGEWKPLVKMIKKWNQTAGKPVTPSFLLEAMALELLVPEFSGGYPYELTGFFATAAHRIKETWGDPAKLGPAVSDQMDEAKASVARGAFLAAEQSVSRAIRLAKRGHQGDALEEWRKLFGPLFPLS